MSNIKLRHSHHRTSSRTCPLPASRVAKIGLLLSAAFLLQMGTAYSATILLEPVGSLGHEGQIDANDYAQYDAAKDDFVAVEVSGSTPPVANAAPTPSTSTTSGSPVPLGRGYVPTCNVGNSAEQGQYVNIAGRSVLSCSINGAPGQKPDPATDCNQSPSAGNPISINTGLKVQTEVDYAGPDGLSFVRTYRSSIGRFESVLTSISDAYPAAYILPYLEMDGVGLKNGPRPGSFRIRSYDANKPSNEPARVTDPNPRIRVKNHKKAKIHIGDRVPVITTTTNTNSTSESVNYLDVGIKLEVEPSVMVSDEVSIDIGLEVSNIAKEITSKSGTLTYQVGTRNANTTLRLKNGETQVLAGLINDTERSSSNRVPGLSSLPLIGRLFANKNDTHDKNEIVLLITPRIVRNVVPPEANLGEFSVGTESGNAPSGRATAFGYVPPIPANTTKREPSPAPLPVKISQEPLQPKSINITQQNSATNTGQQQVSPQPLPALPALPAPRSYHPAPSRLPSNDSIFIQTDWSTRLYID